MEGFATNPFPPFDYSNISGRLVAYSFKKIVCIYILNYPMSRSGIVMKIYLRPKVYVPSKTKQVEAHSTTSLIKRVPGSDIGLKWVQFMEKFEVTILILLPAH